MPVLHKTTTAWVYHDTCPFSAKLFQCPITDDLNSGRLDTRTGKEIVALEQTEDGHTDGTESSAGNEGLRGWGSGVAGRGAASRTRDGRGSGAKGLGATGLGGGDDGVGGRESGGSAGVDLRQRCLLRTGGSRDSLAEGADLV